jgi:Flp pilus assembly protein TadD
VGRVLAWPTVVWVSLPLLTLPGQLVAWAFPEQPVQAPKEVDRREEARQHKEGGITLARQVRYSESVREFRAAAEDSSNDAGAYYGFGISLNQLGESDQDFDAFRTAARLRPSSAPIHLQLALALLRHERLQDATGEFRQAITLEPKSAEAHYNLGLALPH